MTANVFSEDKANRLAPGMNDFLPKPVVPERLYSALLHWLADAWAYPPRSRPALHPGKGPQSTEAQLPSPSVPYSQASATTAGAGKARERCPHSMCHRRPEPSSACGQQTQLPTPITQMGPNGA